MCCLYLLEELPRSWANWAPAVHNARRDGTLDGVRFADHLRTWGPEALAEFLSSRPDLLMVSDRGFDAVARKASSPMSLGRCLVRSDVAMLVIADALTVLNPATPAELDELLGTDDVDAVIEAVERLAGKGIVVVEDGVVSPVGSLDDLLHRPLGLGPSFVDLADHLAPEAFDRLTEVLSVGGARNRSATARAIARRLTEASVVARLLEPAPELTEAVLAELVAQRSPAVGLPAAFRYRDPDEADPLGWMLANGLLVPVTDGVAELPREIVIALSSDGLAPGARLRPISLRPVVGLDGLAVAAAGADQAGRTLEAAEALLRMIGDGEVAIRKAGGVGVREVRRLAKECGLEPRDVGRVLETLHETRLIKALGLALTTTDLADLWWALDRPKRWSVLVWAWSASPSFSSRALSTDQDGSQLPALGAAEPVAAAYAGRQVVLDVIGHLQPGEAFDQEQLTEAVVWRSPKVWGAGEPPPELLVEWTLAEAELLGLIAMDAPTDLLRSVAVGDHVELDAAARLALGRDQSQLVLQGDLSAVALGPLDPQIAGKLSEVAERQTGLSVPTYRFSEASIRRGFDRGWSAGDIEAFLEGYALSGLPQPLRYLIADVERRYGSVRVLEASAVIVTDDEAIAVEIASTARAARIGLRLIAPTVLIGPIDGHQLLDELRAEGLFPVLDGSTLTISGRSSRAGKNELVDDESQGGRLETADGLPADWTGPLLSEAALPGEVADAVAAMQADEDITATSVERDHRLHLLWNRRAIIKHLRGGELVESRGVIVGLDGAVTVLAADGIEEVELEAVVSVEDPSR